MGQAHAQLCQALPQLAFLIRARLPPDLEGLVRRERTSLVQQTAGVRQGLRGRKRFLGDGLNARRAIRQGSSESVAWSSLLRTPLFVSIAIADHVRPGSRPCEARRCGCSDHTWLKALSPGGGARGQPVTPSASFSSVVGTSSCPTRAPRASCPHHTDPPGLARHGVLRTIRHTDCRTRVRVHVASHRSSQASRRRVLLPMPVTSRDAHEPLMLPRHPTRRPTGPTGPAADVNALSLPLLSPANTQ